LYINELGYIKGFSKEY